MTRRKKKVAAKAKQASKGNGSSDPSADRFQLTGPEVREGEKYFSSADLSVYELAQYKLRTAMQASRLKQHEADEYQRKANQKLAQMQIQKKQLDVDAAQKKQALIELQDAITEKYGVDLSQVTYDDETGRITVPPPNDAEGSQPAA
jgi:hypothetical protein